MNVVAHRQEGYQLLQDGLVELAQVERNGIRIDFPRLAKTKQDLQNRLRVLKEELTVDEVWKIWRRRYGEKANLTSRDQLATILHVELDFEVTETTETGKPSTDEEALQKIDNPFVAKLVRFLKYEKALGTFLKGIEKEIAPDGRLHPSFNLHMARTYRSCIAYGTLIEVVRDVSVHPKGIPIEKIKEGDYVYCYDDDLRLTIRKVLWAGKTGHKKVVRLHWGARGKKGHLDLTPDHRVRLSDGRYVPAKDLVGDLRSVDANVHSYKVRTLAMGRRGDFIWQTGRQEVIYDHRLVYSVLKGPLDKNEVVHHKDKNHFNNVPDNLEKKSKSKHVTDHALEGDYWTVEDRRRGMKRRMEMHRSGISKWHKGEKNHNWLSFTKYQLLKLLAMHKGKISCTSFDFGTLQKKASLLGIDVKEVKARYDWQGVYISRGRLTRSFDGTVVSVVDAFRCNFEKAKRLVLQRGWSVLPTCPYGRRAVPNNHRIWKVEELFESVDVYDIEVEGCHNFIANEICVHNSSDSPNFQNFPVRDKEISEIIRSHFIASDGSVLMENDFKGIEVSVSACYHHDPNFISYITTPGKDMHRDMAAQIYCLKPKEVSKDARYGAKNKFVFPQFYGDFYVSCARSLWEWITKGKLTGPDGIPLLEHLKRRGITKLGKCDPDEKPREGTFEKHLQEVEDDFWNHRFMEYGRWRKEWYQSYLEKGYFDLLSGFRVYGSFNRNSVVNYPVQGSAFHCLLWTLIQVNRLLRKYRMRSMVVGQIHDSLIGDIRINELKDYLEILEEVVTVGLRKHYEWLVVPLEIEYEVCPIGGNWFQKQEMKFKQGKFLHPTDPSKFTVDARRFLETIGRTKKI